MRVWEHTFDWGFISWSQDCPIDEADHEWEHGCTGIEDAEPETTRCTLLLFGRREELLDLIIVGVLVVVVLRIVEMSIGP